MFGAMAAMEVASSAANFAAALISALAGAGFWSLVIGQMAGLAVSVIGDRQLSGWRPSRPSWSASAFPMLRFGANLTGFNLLSTFSLYADNALVGLLNGPVALGLFDKAFSLVLRPLSSITALVGRVATPLLSRLDRDPEAYRRSYLSMLQAIMLLALPGLVVGCLMTTEVTRTLLGSHWIGSASIMTWICAAAMFTPFSGSTYWLFTSQGRPNDQLKCGFLSSSLILVSMLCGLPWGARGIAASYAIFAPAVHGCFMQVATRSGPVRLHDVVKATIPILTGILIAFIVVHVIQTCVPFPSFIRIVLALTGAYVSTILVTIAFPQGRRSLLSLKSLRGAA